MAISLKTAGTWAEYTADGTVAIPGTPASGDRMFLFVTWRDYVITITDPSGWTPIGTEYADGAVTAGGGTGSVKVMAWYRDWQSGDSAPNLDFSTATNLIAGAVIQLWTKGGSDSWGTPLTVTGPWAASASATISADSTVAVPDNSVVMGLLGFRDNIDPITRGATTGITVASGIAWNGNYVESPATHFNTTTGIDASGDLGHRFVTTGGTVTLQMEAVLDTSESGAAKWVIQGLGAPAAALEGTSSITFTTSGALSTSILLTGTSTITFTAAGMLYPAYTQLSPIAVSMGRYGDFTAKAGTAAVLEGTSSITFSSAGELSTVIQLTGTSTVNFTLAGELTTGIVLTGTSTVVFTSAGELTTSILLTGTSSVVFTTSSELTTSILLTGSPSIVFTTSGELTTSILLTGTSTVVFTSTADLTAPAQAALDGTSSIEFSTTGALTTSIDLTGEADLAFTSAGELTTDVLLTGTSSIVFTSSGTLTTGINLSGEADLVFTSTGSLSTSILLTGTSSVVFTSAGQITTSIDLDGVVTIVFTAEGILTDEIVVTLIYTRRLSVIGTSQQRLTLEGASAKRITLEGASAKRLTLEGCSP